MKPAILCTLALLAILAVLASPVAGQPHYLAARPTSRQHAALLARRRLMALRGSSGDRRRPLAYDNDNGNDSDDDDDDRGLDERTVNQLVQMRRLRAQVRARRQAMAAARIHQARAQARAARETALVRQRALAAARRREHAIRVRQAAFMRRRRADQRQRQQQQRYSGSDDDDDEDNDGDEHDEQKVASIRRRRRNPIDERGDGDSTAMWQPATAPPPSQQQQQPQQLRNGVPAALRGFCNQAVYINGRPTFAGAPATQLLPYTKPSFPATARATREGGLVIQRLGTAKNLAAGALHKYGFQTAEPVTFPGTAKLVRFYAQVRFGAHPSLLSAPPAAVNGTVTADATVNVTATRNGPTTPILPCAVKDAAVSVYYGAKRMGGRVWRAHANATAVVPMGRWIDVAVTVPGDVIAVGDTAAARITVQGAHDFVGAQECTDGLTFEVRRVLACANTKKMLFALTD
ncbi:hypothetical protein BC828DRAFT_395691 [Blastocladiella britannica]|nr:hypothetical protein BC828DRAFT_395691 [Blastocladiella britannica]